MEKENSLVRGEGWVTLDRATGDFSEVTSDLRCYSEEEPVHVRMEEACVRGRGRRRCMPLGASELGTFKEHEAWNG